MQPGSIVKFRGRDWILLPSPKNEVIQLQPLTGAIHEHIAVHKKISELVRSTIPEEDLRPSQFPLPSPDDVSDYVSAKLLWEAARLNLRDGAAPIRSLSHISIRPRTYQFVPLLMALRLDPVRLFIADDVGVGKTIEALLIARELIDRGEIQRLAVLCPPYLCDQWEKELNEKFNLEATVFRSSTISKLERRTPQNKSIYEYYPIQVISIDWVKSERNKHLFLQYCPEMVIVDEVHGAAAGTSRKVSQQRHQLLKAISKDPNRHLILLTATPHSGVETAFRSLLGLIKPEFQQWDLNTLDENKRTILAKHFVQRTRKDIETDWESEHYFPERISEDKTYVLSNTYNELFQKTYEFCSQLVRTGPGLNEYKKRVQYWGALALLRCVMSSPAAAQATLENQMRSGTKGIDDLDDNEDIFEDFVYEDSEDLTNDENPIPPIEKTAIGLAASGKRQLRELARLAQKLYHSKDDTKLFRGIDIVRELLNDGFQPIVWCRYVATAEYVAEGLRKALPNDVQVIAITGRMADDERRIKIAEIDPQKPRVLVATDCLSEGVNLQEKFNAVIHYDLPWNPNRMEQREGRVDRYGQPYPKVKAIRFFGKDNPVDGAVINVLLDKAKAIHRVLGTYVPVPKENESVVEAIVNSLFIRKQPYQPTLFDLDDVTAELHKRWDEDVQRERVNRTRFAQRAIKPEEVVRELEEVDKVLGDPEAVKHFVINAAQRLGIQFQAINSDLSIIEINLSEGAISTLPDAIRFILPPSRQGRWRISFVSPVPEGCEYVGRNHRLVATLAQYILEESLTKGADAVASRCGVMRTNSVAQLTTLLLLRVRYLLDIPQQTPLLAEEVLVLGFRPPEVGEDIWLAEDEALQLLVSAQPAGDIPLSEKKELAQWMLEKIGEWPEYIQSEALQNSIQQGIKTHIELRARQLEVSHKRIRKAVKLRVRELKIKPQFPPDILGMLILQPEVTG